jgi:hypothetical protein
MRYSKISSHSGRDRGRFLDFLGGHTFNSRSFVKEICGMRWMAASSMGHLAFVWSRTMSSDQYTSLDVAIYGLVDGRSDCRRRTYMVAHACMGFGVQGLKRNIICI